MHNTSHDPVVLVVDDEPEFLESVRWLLESANLNVLLFSSSREFLDYLSQDIVGCLVTDLRMPGMSGLELQKTVRERHPDLPVIIMTAHGDIDTAVTSLKHGAVDFIQKPFNDQVLLDLINKAITQCSDAVNERLRRNKIVDRFSSLSPRETEVLNLVIEGKTNKIIAELLGISDKTVEAHRARVMDKTRSKSLADLIKLKVASESYKGKP